ncbi:coiled-coil domain-containing protein 25-like [Teleopsis dalmanni]|uniref:coiled-coil domain-containing protein 25-like n=1 Tax=Teleopsis dalmanni TaxID=139649 RepID=UPI0018CF5D39|nr:coiled-coil domain-containing protein 25-like [Teleopsis dalmanni]XP_037949732.1 coiled-coil domain-containing protein 25-like [Teleopsis dalmanni]
MVFYFESNVVSPPCHLYMGKDKHENEELIRWGWPEDVWFHVSDLSSAHVYLRLQKGQTFADIPTEVLNDAAQLVKANSIQGNKMKNIEVVYTPWENLKKTPAMEAGQVAFHRDDQVKKILVEKRNNEIVNRLNKTKKEDHPDLREQREKRDMEENKEKKRALQMQQAKEKDELKRKEEEAKIRNYVGFFKPDQMKSNYDDGNESDDFM